MPTSESSSESEPEFESIIATRARRSNAGSRLRQLLDLEETNNATLPINEEDENVNLLFMEDENDREFEGSEDDDVDEEEEEEGIDDDNHEDKNGDNANGIVSKTKQNKSQNLLKKKNEIHDENDEEEDENSVSAVNSDEMLSDSDISASDEDESEGERELQKEERLRKRRKRKSDMPPILQRKKVKPSTTQKKQVTLVSSNETNKTNKSKIEPIAPTLRRHSTRKTTIESSIATHERLEKEYERKQTQAPVEKKVYVEKTLEERLEEAKVTEKENILSLTRFYEQEVQKKKKQRDLSNSKKFKMTNFIRFSSKGTFITPNDEVRIIEKELQKLKEEEEQKNKRKLQYLKRKQARITKTENTETIDKELNKEVEAVKSDLNKGTDVKVKSEDNDKKNELEKEQSTEGEIKNENGKVVRFEEDERANTDIVESNNKPKNESDISKNDNENENSISNDGETEQSNVETNQIDVDEDGDSTPTVIYEGPPQLVTRNYIIFEEFEKTLSNDEIKKKLFGPQSTLSGSHYDPLYETLCVIKQDKSSNIDLQKIQEARDESFKSLIKLPKFGEKITVSNDDDGKSSTEENEVVNIHTPAPIGIHLPNGQKKMCIVSGLPATYYDPTNGVPYSTVDAFKILKGIVDGEYEWLQLDNGGINSRFAGGIGCYLGKKNQRHAAGVPEGFN